MGARMSQAAPVGDASIPAASETDAFIAAFCWQPLSGGVMIGARDGSRGTMSGQPHSGSVVACDSACSGRNHYVPEQTPCTKRGQFRYYSWTPRRVACAPSAALSAIRARESIPSVRSVGPMLRGWNA